MGKIPAEYGGIMWFTSKGKKYRLTRNFFIKKRSWESFSVKMMAVLWMRNRELLGLFWEM